MASLAAQIFKTIDDAATREGFSADELLAAAEINDTRARETAEKARNADEQNAADFLTRAEHFRIRAECYRVRAEQGDTTKD
jgi:hypothetical protein